MGVEELKKAAAAFKQRQADEKKAQAKKAPVVRTGVTREEISTAVAAFKGPIRIDDPGIVDGKLQVHIIGRSKYPSLDGYIVRFRRLGSSYEGETIVALANLSIWTTAIAGRKGVIEVRRLPNSEVGIEESSKVPTVRILTPLKPMPFLSPRGAPEGPNKA